MNLNHTAKLRRVAAVLLAVALFVPALQAQLSSVRGIVSDPSGEPLIGVSVVASESGNGTTTDLDGQYSIKVNPQGQLSFSYVGFETATVDVDGRSTINVTLRESSEALNELVVVGYGVMKKSDLTGAVGSIGGKDIKDAPVNSVGQAIQGKIAGVQIIDAAKPGDNVNIKIRGLGSISNCDPLVVIDGVPTDLGLNSINPADIERLDVLKDASATAIYGSRGANGVVLITTRRGAEGANKFGVSINLAAQTASKKMKLLDAAGYASYNNDMMLESGKAPNPEWLDPASLGAGTDWVDELLHTGFMQNYTANYSGGTDKAHYYFSFGFLDQSAIVKNVDYRRYTLQSNNDVTLTKWLKVSNNLMFSADAKKSGDYNMGNVMQALPTFPVKDADGEWSGPTGNQDWYGSMRNVVGQNDMYIGHTQGTNFLANVSADIIFCDWLQFRSTFGFDAKMWDGESFSPKYDWKPSPVEESSMYESHNKSFTYLWDNYFTFDKKFGKNYLNVMAGMSAQWNDYRWFDARMKGFLFDNVHQFNNGIEMDSMGGTRSEWSLLSYMARANYSYDDKYLLTATVRRDGSSRFGPKHRWGTFPSASAAWRISGEDFFPKDKAVNDLKLRVGYGQTGSQNSVGLYGYLPTYETGEYPFGPDPENPQQALLAQSLSNPYVHWETVEQWNGGIDIALFKNRLTISLDGYIKNTRDMLVKATVPITSGFEDVFDMYTNAGRVKNIGWELSANSVNFDTRDFKWETGLVLTYNKNRIVDLNSEVDMFRNEINHAYVTMLREHRPMNVFYGYLTDGIFQTPEEVAEHAIQTGAAAGDIRFKDLNGDGVINDKDRTIIGNPNPAWLFSLNNRFEWRGFDLSIYLQGVGGNKIYNATRMTMEGMNGAVNQYATVENRWTGEGTSNTMPRAVWADPNGNCRISDRFVEDGSYLRLKNITLGYNLPKSVLRHIGMENARVSFSAENVATITGYSGFDPEVGIDGIDRSSFPLARTFNFGLSFNF